MTSPIKPKKSMKTKIKKVFNKRLTKLVLTAIVLGTVFLFTNVFNSNDGSSENEIEFSEAVTRIENNEFETVTLQQNAYILELSTNDEEENTVTSIFPRGYEEKLIDIIESSDATLVIETIDTDNFFSNLILAIAPILLIVILILYLMGGMNNVFKDQNKADRPDTSLKDVAGVKEAVEEVQEIVDYLRDPEPFKRLTAKPPSGVLLIGPPGTGKTLLARAIAGEANVPFFQTTGASFVEMFAGVGPKRVKALFKAAKKSGKAVIFIDEIDAIGGKRNSQPGDAMSKEMNSTLTTLLTEIDGFEQNDIIVIGATNLPETIDPALQRRLHKVVEVPLPDSKGREQILELHARNRPFADNVNWKNIAKETTGFSGAQLAIVVDSACLIATRRNADVVEEKDLLEATVTIHVGKERKSAVMTEFDKNVTAWHEAGHTVVAKAMKHAMNPSYVTIIPRGQSGGHTRFNTPENTYFSREQVEAQLAAIMGGRAAEVIIFGENGFTQGAGSDLQVATNIAFEYVTKYGMGSRLSVIDNKTLDVGTNIAMQVNNEVEEILQKAFDKAVSVLRENYKVLEKLKNELREKETVEGLELDELLSKVKTEN